MSGAATDAGDELVVLAGEYVLGTLPRDEAAQLAREAEADPAVAGAIALWQRQLSPLGLLVPPVTPPAALWPRIETSLRAETNAAAPMGSGVRPQVAASRGGARWRAATAAGFLLAAGIAGIAILERPTAAVPVAVLSPLGAGRAAFVIEARRDGSLAVVPMSPAPVPAGRDLELWSLAAGAKVPQPLGVLPATGMRVAADHVPAGGQILVSLEPKGGSPTGLPTGPVLYGAALPGPAL